jgi:hypothetical protein
MKTPEEERDHGTADDGQRAERAQESNERILAELKHALTFLGQAQELCANQSTLWKDLGAKYDELDGMIESIEDGDYGDQ